MVKKRQFILTYNKHNKVWRKMYRGESIICGYVGTHTGEARLRCGNGRDAGE